MDFIKKLNFADFILAIFLMGKLTGILFAPGSSISKAITLATFAIMFFCYIYSFIYFNLPKPLKLLGVFVLILSVYGLLIGNETFYTSINSYTREPYLRGLWRSILPVFVFYYLTCKSYINDEKISKWVVILFVFGVAEYLRDRYNIATNRYYDFSRDEFVNNGGYIIASIFPSIIFLSGNAWKKYTLMLLCLALVLMSFKRGAILISAVLILLLIYFIVRSSSKTIKGRVFFVSLVAIVFTYYVFDYFFTSSALFMERFMLVQSGDSSGRDVLFSDALGYLKSLSSVKYLLFGRGAYGTLPILGNFAHNDWLEILICQGLIGGLLYFAYFVNFYKTCSFRKSSSVYNKALCLAFVYLLLRSFFSMSYNDMPLYISCIVGYCFARINTVSNEYINSDSRISD